MQLQVGDMDYKCIVKTSPKSIYRAQNKQPRAEYSLIKFLNINIYKKTTGFDSKSYFVRKK